MKAYGVFFEDCLCHIEPSFMYTTYMHKKDAEDHAEALTRSGFFKYVAKEVVIEKFYGVWEEE